MAWEAEGLDQRHIGPLVGRQDELGQADVGQALHLGQALQHGGAGVGNLALVGVAGEIAGAEADIGMGRTDEAVGVGFDGDHFRPLISCRIDAGFRASKEATG
jgi:hypothetical protein